MPTTREIPTTSPIGRSTPRVDGPLKVSGRAQYASDFHFPGMLYAVPVEATIANGRVVKLDTAAAEKMPGVRAIFHRENIGKIFRSVQGPGFAGIMDERRPPFEDDVVRYYGQYIALAVADTFETAKAAADAVRVTYAQDKPNVDTDLKADDEPDVVATTFGMLERLESERGDADAAFATAPVKLDQTYVTPAETHNPIELHATTAIWDGSTLTLYEASQGVFNLRGVLAQMFGLPKENVRVITKFVGSGFGSKLWPWTHCPLAAAAARQLGKPVKLVVSRKMMFQTVGHRPRTQQRVRLGATPDGKLVSLQHDYVYHRSMLDAHHEDCGEATPFQYSVPNLRVTFGPRQAQRRLDDDMRGPGAVPGLYATESAMNELADQLKIDPGPTPRHQRAEDRRVAGHSVLVAPLARVLRARRGEVRLVQAHARGRLDEARRPDARLGNGRVRVDRRAIPRRGERPAPRRRHGPRRMRHAGHRHRHVHDPRAAHLAEDRRAARQGRSRARRHVASGRPDLGRLDGDRLGGPGGLCGGRQRDRLAADDRDGDARIAVREAQARRAGLRGRPGLREGRRCGGRRAVRGCAPARQPAPGHGQRQVRSDVRQSEAEVLDALVRLSLRRGHVAAGDRPAARQPGRDGHRCGTHPEPAGRPEPDRRRGRDGNRHGAVRAHDRTIRRTARRSTAIWPTTWWR